MRAVAVALLAAVGTGALPADGRADPPGGVRGDPARGRTIVVNRQQGLCLLCHAGPFPEERFQGNLGPALDGVGARLPEAALRQRLVDPARFDPDSLMPAYARVSGLQRVAPSFQGRPVLSDQQIEDVVAFLATLK